MIVYSCFQWCITKAPTHVFVFSEGLKGLGKRAMM